MPKIGFSFLILWWFGSQNGAYEFWVKLGMDQSILAKVWSVKLERGRIHLATAVTDAVPALAKRQDLWLFALDSGRFRILTKEALESSRKLQSLISLLQEAERGDDAADAISPAAAVLPLQLMQVQLSRQGSLGWRFGFPRELMPLAGIWTGDTVYLVLVQGFLEIWSIAYTRTVLASSPEDG
jgi:hypothetical protein